MNATTNPCWRGNCVDVVDQAGVDAATSAGQWAHASGSATVRASGSATVYASGSATVHAYDSATVHAYGSATVHASGSATVHAYGSATVRASGWVAIHRHGNRVTVTEGTTATVIQVPERSDVAEWAAYHGVDVLDDGRVVVFKGVYDNLASEHWLPDGTKCVYTPGVTLEAPDWSPSTSCGPGLHFSPTPHHTLRYASAAERFLACAVVPSETVVIDGGDRDKVKAKSCEVLYEVDLDGVRLDDEVTV